MMSYLGPFTSEYRDDIKKQMIVRVHKEKIPYTPGWEFPDFMVGQAIVKEWN